MLQGSYDFTCATTGDVATVFYTFGYKRCADGKPRIFLHHSSVPYVAAPAAAPAKGKDKAAKKKRAAEAERRRRETSGLVAARMDDPGWLSQLRGAMAAGRPVLFV